ncbi:hypothetical protein JTB14_034237 [Gonioctena quinquepunctata]|nr:hypothetical protein JTB14_034237 [Gonioctena quinquepunctata]
MENPEEVLHSLEEFSKMKPKDIPRELEEYLCFVAKTGNPIYQWPTIKSLFREKLLNVITEFYESCPSVDIPPCPNVEMFNYDMMKNFILEKLDTFASAPFTVQRICELLTTPRKEYNRIDKYMRALEKNILVVSTTEPGRRSTENGDGIMNGIETEHGPESSNSSHDINIEDMDEAPSWPRTAQVAPLLFDSSESESASNEAEHTTEEPTSFEPEPEVKPDVPTSTSCTAEEPPVQHQETVITCTSSEDTTQPFVSIEAVPIESCVTSRQDITEESPADVSVTITAIPANVQQRRTSIERVGDSDPAPTVAEEEAKVPFVIEETKLDENTQIQVIQEEIVVSESNAETAELPKIDPEQSSEAEAEVAVPASEETISPETSSTSAEVLQPEVSSGSEKSRLEETVGELEKIAEEEKIEENEASEAAVTDVPIESSKEVPEAVAEPVAESSSSSVPEDELEVDNIADSSTDCQEKEVPEKCDDAPVSEEMKVEEEKIEATVAEVPEDKKEPEETPMEVDVVSEEANKEEEKEEPSSSSVDIPL